MKHWQAVGDRGPNASDYYSVHRLIGGRGAAMAALRELFPEGEANELNFVLFSTSGVHGTYCTIEACEAGDTKDVTFLVIQPRIVALRYGNVEPLTPDDFTFLKKLRASSIKAVLTYGAPEFDSGLGEPPKEEASPKPGTLGVNPSQAPSKATVDQVMAWADINRRHGPPDVGNQMLNNNLRLLTREEAENAYANVPWLNDGASSPDWMDRINAVQRKLLEVNGLTVTDGVTAAPAQQVSAKVPQNCPDPQRCICATAPRRCRRNGEDIRPAAGVRVGYQSSGNSGELIDGGNDGSV
jgi:hypothetical protein